MAEQGSTRAPGYGTPNWEMIGRWFDLAPADDTPFWAVNLMKYKARADYGGDGDHGLSGREADDAYTPLGSLAAIGAMVAFAGEVVEQRGGTPAWDRVGIVRYPNRAAFFAMQQRDDFKDQHVHKEAGMDTTIVLSCLPVDGGPVVTTPDGGQVVVRVGRSVSVDDAAGRPGVTALSRFAVEGVIVGDDRTWDHVSFDHVAAGETLAALTGAADPDAFTLVVAPSREFDRLADSIRTAPSVPPREA